MPDPTPTQPLPELPNAWDYAYEWDSPMGLRRSFDYAPHNGVKPDRHVSLFTADQMLAFRAEGIRAAIEADRAARHAAWQPIETAPKVVGRIIGWVDGRARFICWGKASHVPIFGWVLTDQGPEECDLCAPTHWMPLPAAPSLPVAAQAVPTTGGAES